MPRAELTDITVTLLHETEKAWLVYDGVRKVWLPKKACELELNPDGKTYTLILPVSLAEDKELI